MDRQSRNQSETVELPAFTGPRETILPQSFSVKALHHERNDNCATHTSAQYPAHPEPANVDIAETFQSAIDLQEPNLVYSSVL
jgi:hypothetical protein